MKKILKHQLAISLLILNAVIFILFSPTHFFFELFLSMAFQIMIGIGILAIVFLVYKKWIGTGVSLIAILLIYSNISYLETEDAHISGADFLNLKVAHFNVLKFNKDYIKTIDAIKENDADIVSINEMTHDWKEALDTALITAYPYRYLVAQNNSFGIGIFSKSELSKTETIWFEGIPYISGIMQVSGVDVRFLTAHTIPPTSKNAYAKRNNQLDHVKTFLKKDDHPKIVIGDLNAVSWSPVITRFKENLNLSDSRTSFQPSYPAWNKLLMIPIDHIFFSKEIKCLSFNTISNTSSDHYGIVGEYLL